MPRKLGQHFLVRDTILERLAAAACPHHTARVIEIGAGRGALTCHLLPRTDELHAIELDTSLINSLRRKFEDKTKLQIHAGDVLSIDLSQWGPAVLAGNLPYYITSPIIHKFLALDRRFPLAVFLLQEEVAERLLAQPGTRAYGYLTVAAQLVSTLELVCRVPASAFSPPPKVDSAAVRFQRKAEIPAHVNKLLEFVGRCFAHKRKTLRNNLRSFYGPAVDDIPEAVLRAEQLSLPRFIELFQRLSYTETS